MILGVGVDATSYEEATARVVEWARKGESRMVCLGVVASVMEARESARYREALEEADLVTADGMPLVWMLRRLGVRPARRVYGPDLMVAVLRAAETAGLAVGFYGSSEEVMGRLVANLRARFPRLEMAYREAPPFRPLTKWERRVGGAGDPRVGGANFVRRAGRGEAGLVDGGASGTRAGGDAGGGRGVRFSGGDEAAGSTVDAGGRSGMSVPVGDGTTQAVEAVSEAQSTVRMAGD